ncbi:MAG: CusA/CzcA family heavy metal efflux RND transporter [Deltaproteobacteria bacterium]|nr:CusA/CzcA family heavy metal efflux RND transporter [Deltaproteobacteria bacterium]
MLERILRFSIDHRGLVVLAVLVAAAYGAFSLANLPIDAVPDITNRQVQVNAVAPSLSPVEVETQVAFPIETALAGIPGLDYTRSFSRNGFAQVTAVFHDDVDVYFARQQVSERLGTIRDDLPQGVETTLGPISTGLGEIYMWTVAYEHPDGVGAPHVDGEPGWQSDGSYLTPEGEILRTELERAAYLRTVQDWIIRPQLAGTPGVAAIDTIGGYVKQYHVQPEPRALAAYGLTFADVLGALARNNLSTGAGYLEHGGDSYAVRAASRLANLEDIERVVVVERDGKPIRVGEVAEVVIGRELRTGSASKDGEEAVVGTAMMLFGANSRTVAAAVDERMRKIETSLPPDIRARTVLDRTQLVDATIHTVATNLAEGAVLVIVVLFLLLGNVRAALITALAIPLSMLLTAIGMAQTHTSGNLMSLGAIDFGLIVDGAVIVVENCLRRLAERQAELGRPLTRAERLSVVFDASRQVRKAAAFGEAIIITVYLPILTLTGVEGKMFQPMALTVIFALTAAFVLSLTFVPAMVALCITGRVRERENVAVALAKSLYAPALRWSLRWRGAVVATGAVLFAASLLLLRTLGQEFAPTLAELDLVVHAFRVPGTSLTQATSMQRELEKAIDRVPEVASVFSRSGTAEVASDPMPVYMSDTFVVLKPREAWPNPRDTKEDVRARIEEVIERVPGNAYEFTQPIEMRFNELLAGVRSDVAIKVFGDDFERLQPIAERIARILRAIPGAADVSIEPISGAPFLGIEVDHEASARYGLSAADVHDVVSIAIGGRSAGQVFEGDRRFDLLVRLHDEFRDDPLALGNLPIPVSHEHTPATAVALQNGERAGLRYLPLSAVAQISVADGPNQVSRENGKRRIVVQTNVRGRDIGSFVEEAQERIDRDVDLPTGTWLSWGGQYENLVQAKERLLLVVPICFLLILMLLYGTFGSIGPALLVFTAVPLALSGGIVSLWLRDMPFSISAGVGFIALSGVAVLNGLVMITFIDQLRDEGVELDDAIVSGAVTRLRPVLMTALVASLGFIPMALATGTGAEVQRPLATVVVGGLVSSAALTLFVLPALYHLAAPLLTRRAAEPNEGALEPARASEG